MPDGPEKGVKFLFFEDDHVEHSLQTLGPWILLDCSFVKIRFKDYSACYRILEARSWLQKFVRRAYVCLFLSEVKLARPSNEARPSVPSVGFASACQRPTKHLDGAGESSPKPEFDPSAMLL